jgi:5'-methylthioadenosine phosphorylase
VWCRPIQQEHSTTIRSSYPSFYLRNICANFAHTHTTSSNHVHNKIMPKIGVIGGSGLYNMEGMTDVKEVTMDTPFGKPSDNYISGTLNGVECVFLSRHGRGHVVNPSEVNYRANIMGMKMLGVEWIISVTACGSLQEEIVPGDMVIIDQFIDRTVQRPATFFENGIVGHVPFARPLCDTLRGFLKQACETLNITHHWGGIYVNMEGPAFSTEAESNMHRSWGAKVIGMTNMTEARLAREAEISLATISMATDYDCWRQGHESVTVEQVMKTAGENVEKAKRIVAETIKIVSGYSGKKPPAQCALGGGGAIMTAKDKIPQDRLVALAPIIGAYLPAGQN